MQFFALWMLQSGLLDEEEPPPPPPPPPTTQLANLFPDPRDVYRVGDPDAPPALVGRVAPLAALHVEADAGAVYGWRRPPTDEASRTCASPAALDGTLALDGALPLYVLGGADAVPATFGNAGSKPLTAAHFRYDNATGGHDAAGARDVAPGAETTFDVRAGDYVDWLEGGALARRSLVRYPGHTGHVFEEDGLYETCRPDVPLSEPLRTLVYYDVAAKKNFRAAVYSEDPLIAAFPRAELGTAGPNVRSSVDVDAADVWTHRWRSSSPRRTAECHPFDGARVDVGF